MLLQDLIAEKPDLTLNETAVAMYRRRIAGRRSVVWWLFTRRNISPKKNLRAAAQRRTSVTRGREHWIRGQGKFDPNRLMIFDETFMNTGMSRLRGRSM